MSVLHIWEVGQLGVILDAASRTAKVRWLASDGQIVEGTARHIVKSPEDFSFIGTDQDVRDAYLRITARSGMEHVVPVRRLMELVDMGGFAVDE